MVITRAKQARPAALRQMDQEGLYGQDLHLVAPRNCGAGTPLAASTCGEERVQTMNGSCRVTVRPQGHNVYQNVSTWRAATAAVVAAPRWT